MGGGGPRDSCHTCGSDPPDHARPPPLLLVPVGASSPPAAAASDTAAVVPPPVSEVHRAAACTAGRPRIRLVDRAAVQEAPLHRRGQGPLSAPPRHCGHRMAAWGAARGLQRQATRSGSVLVAPNRLEYGGRGGVQHRVGIARATAHATSSPFDGDGCRGGFGVVVWRLHDRVSAGAGARCADHRCRQRPGRFWTPARVLRTAIAPPPSPTHPTVLYRRGLAGPSSSWPPCES